MNKNLFLPILSLLLLFQVIAIVLLRRSDLTFPRYLSIIYSYLSLAILIMVFFFVLWDKFSIVFSSTQTLVIFILSLLSLLGMFVMYHDRPILTHLLWVFFIWSVAVMMYPMIKNTHSSILVRTLIMVVGLLILLSVIALWNSSYSFLRWESGLFLALLILIIVQLLDLLFSSGMTPLRLKIYSGIGCIIFIGYMLYDTQLLKIKYESCKTLASSSDFSKCINYPVSSLGIFLDAVNLFSSLVNLQN